MFGEVTISSVHPVTYLQKCIWWTYVS